MSQSATQGPRRQAKKSLGQNFLIDPNVVRKIVGCLDVQPLEAIVEIGPGRGALTKVLLEQGARVIALEKDSGLAVELKTRHPDVQLAVADALKCAWIRLPQAGIGKVIGNLPYNIASPLIWDLTAQFQAVPGRIVVMLQKEVARRLTASPGSRVYGALSVWVQTFVQPRLEFILSPEVFRPRPRVDSAVVSMSCRSERPTADEGAALAGLLRVCFQKRRKQLKTSLRGVWSGPVQEWFAAHGVDPRTRAEALTPGEFLSLAQVLPAAAWTGDGKARH